MRRKELRSRHGGRCGRYGRCERGGAGHQQHRTRSGPQNALRQASMQEATPSAMTPRAHHQQVMRPVLSERDHLLFGVPGKRPELKPPGLSRVQGRPHKSLQSLLGRTAGEPVVNTRNGEGVQHLGAIVQAHHVQRIRTSAVSEPYPIRSREAVPRSSRHRGGGATLRDTSVGRRRCRQALLVIRRVPTNTRGDQDLPR